MASNVVARPSTHRLSFNGSLFSNEVKVSVSLPEGLQLIEATSDIGTHFAIFCYQSIPKGTQFGPYQGTVVKPSEVAIGEDNSFMWEVRDISYFT